MKIANFYIHYPIYHSIKIGLTFLTYFMHNSDFLENMSNSWHI